MKRRNFFAACAASVAGLFGIRRTEAKPTVRRAKPWIEEPEQWVILRGGPADGWPCGVMEGKPRVVVSNARLGHPLRFGQSVYTRRQSGRYVWAGISDEECAQTEKVWGEMCPRFRRC